MSTAPGGPFRLTRSRAAMMVAAVVAVAVVGGVGLVPHRKRDAIRRADLAIIQAALEAYKRGHGHYPPDVPGETAAAGGVDGCVGVMLAGLEGVPEDPLSTGGYAQPGPDRWCYYYRLGRGDGYQLFARLELPWGSPAGCLDGDRYRLELQDFDVCLLADQPHASP